MMFVEHKALFEVILQYHPHRLDSYAPEPRPERTLNPQIARLQGLAEAALAVPGSLALNSGTNLTPVYDSTDAWWRYGVNLAGDDVVAFYKRELSGRGWTTGAGSPVALTDHDLVVCGWHRDDLTFGLRIWKPDDWKHVEPNGRTWETVYEIKIYADAGASGAACDPARP